MQNGQMAALPRLDLRPGVVEPVVLLISRREIGQADLASVLSRLKVFLATREDAWRYRGQMTLVVDGYNHDPRELVDIREVRTLLRRLEAERRRWRCRRRSCWLSGAARCRLALPAALARAMPSVALQSASMACP